MLIIDEKDAVAANTDREIWRRNPGDYSSPSIFVTQDGYIGINVGGLCIVHSVEEWHAFANAPKTSSFERLERRVAELEKILIYSRPIG